MFAAVDSPGVFGASGPGELPGFWGELYVLDAVGSFADRFAFCLLADAHQLELIGAGSLDGIGPAFI